MVHRSRPKSVRVIANPASGKRIPLLHILNDFFGPAGIRWGVDVTRKSGDGAELARHAIEDGAEVILSFGGDGTVMDVANGLVGTDVPLLILAGGTGNLVASELNLPLEVDRAVERICGDSFQSRAIDVGKVGERHFLLRVGCGFETNVLLDTNREAKNQLGKWAYVLAAAKALQDVQVADYRITLDDKTTVEEAGVACVVANAGHVGLGDLSLSPKIDIDDGKLDVIFIRKADVEGIFSLIRMMMGVSEEGAEPDDLARVDASHLVNRWQVERVLVETEPRLKMQADGDVIEQTPQLIHVLPDALQVVV